MPVLASLTSSDAAHLECVEKTSFFPIGWLYRRVFEDLLSRGLVHLTRTNAYILSDAGAEALARYRQLHRSPSPR